MADYKFVELIFELDSGNPTRVLSQFKAAHSSLNRKPQQLFALLVEKEISTAFLSGFESYGKKLARLFGKFPEHFPSPPEDEWGSRKENYNPGLLEETLRAFLFSLLAKDFIELESQRAMADIVMEVIKLSKPEALGLIGERLGEAPSILKILIAEGKIGCLFQEHPKLFKSLTSYNTTFESWTRIVNDHAKCDRHRADCQRILGRETMRKVICTFRDCLPCQVFPSRKEEPEIEILRVREDNFLNFDPNMRTFENILGNHLGIWKMVLSAQALSDLTDSVGGGDVEFTQIQTKLLEIAAGKWAPRSLLKPARSYQVPVFKTFYKPNAVILWQVDVGFDERYYQNSQVIKVWGIGAHGKIAETRDYVIRVQQAYTEARVTACRSEDNFTFTGTAVPKYVELTELSRNEQEKQSASNIATDQQMAESFPMLTKFYSLTTTVISAISSGAQMAVFPMDVSAEEVQIIDHFQTPAFILGRSGTGKTTCLIYKLGSRYMSSKRDGENPVRQLLLTRSRDLAHKLRDYTKNLINTQAGAMNIAPEEEDAEDNANMNSWNDSEEDTDQSLLSLREQDFPLVCTFSFFLRLLENTIKVEERADAPFWRHFRDRDGAVGGSRALQTVDFTAFKRYYWKRFPMRLKKGIQVDLAFIEIMSVIKGAASLTSSLEPLSRGDYIGKRWRLAPNFAESGEREAVYSLYEHYESIKKSRGETDNTDRVIRVMKVLQKSPELRGRVEGVLDEIYVDEVQDQRPLEIELLLHLIQDPRGIHFAGDTAQSISKDALFQFSNAKALFYNRFSEIKSIHNDTLLKPALLPLCKNFRSHQGILSLASLVMELLYTGFPNLVDKLPRETGELHGPKPTLCIGSDLITLIQEMVDSANSASPTNLIDDERDAKKPEFGEERVILVRDVETRDELRPKVKGFALVLTILQSKGMEFEDVFLYNFFTTSSYNSDFAILEKLLHERKYIGSEGEPGRHADWEKNHIVLCSELKNLYVGITRVRSRLWILENESKAVDSVINLFNTTAPKLFPKYYPEKLVEVIREHEFETAGLRERLRSTRQTSSERWRELAYEFMTNKDFQEASFCFEKADDRTGIKLAQAYLSELDGMEYRASGLQMESNLAFQNACELFLSIGRIAKAVACQETMGNYATAAEILSKNDRHEEAAFLFVKAGEHEKAADEYTQLKRQEQVLATYFHGTRYNELVKYLKKLASKLPELHRAQISATCYKQYSRLCYRLLTEEKIAPELGEAVFASLGSEAKQERFFRRLGMLDDVFRLYKRQNKHREAYKIGVSIGFLEDALRVLIEHKQLKWVQPQELVRVFSYIQAGYLLAKFHHPEMGQVVRSNDITTDLIAVGLMDKQLSSMDQLWKSLTITINNYPKSNTKPDRNRVRHNSQMRVLLDLLVTLGIPELTLPRITDLTKHPLEFIHGAIEVLKAISREDILPTSVQLYLGIFDRGIIPRSYIALQWSPLFTSPKLKFPIQILDSMTIKEKSYKRILTMISESLGCIENISQYCDPNDISLRENATKALKTSQISANFQALFAFNLLFLNLETILSGSSISGGNSGNVMLHWPFWRNALLQQMAFVSSHGQNITTVVDARNKLKHSTRELRELRDRLVENHLSDVRAGVRVKERYLSSFLQQMEVAAFLDVEGRCIGLLKSESQRHSKNWELNLAFDVVLLIQTLRSQTGRGDLPGRFCENTEKLLSLLEWIRGQTQQLSFYSSSILSLYEELIVLLIFLIRPTDFLIPQSWSQLHLPKWSKIPRTKSRREIWLYQRLLTKVVTSFCELVRNIEDRREFQGAINSADKVPAATVPKRQESLVRRSLDLLVISIINIGTLRPLPPGYTKVWVEAQKVFKYDTLKAGGLLNVPSFKLIEKLARAFTIYNGKDPIRLLVTEDTDFSARFPKYEITTAKYRGAGSVPRHLLLTSSHLRSREINAAYLITQCWRTRGSRFLKRMKLQRERVYLARTQKLRRFHNCCMLAEMKYGNDWIF